MEKNIFTGMPYLNNYYFCRNNSFLESKLDYYLDKVISASDESYIFYLKKLQREYNFDNYMYILECVLNHIISIYRLTFFDYRDEPNSSSLQALFNIQKRYKNVLALYNEQLNMNDSSITNIHAYRKSYNKKSRYY